MYHNIKLDRNVVLLHVITKMKLLLPENFFEQFGNKQI